MSPFAPLHVCHCSRWFYCVGDRYAEGQYIFLNCPSISGSQWHPFTISSAPQEDSLTLHIRVMGDGSWTRRLQEFLESMGPQGATHYTLTHLDESGVSRPGKVIVTYSASVVHAMYRYDFVEIK
jgi:hypothetical protein